MHGGNAVILAPKLIVEPSFRVNHASNMVLYAENKANAGASTGSSEAKKFECVSCGYVYDESKGFKKMYPPGKLSSNQSCIRYPYISSIKILLF